MKNFSFYILSAVTFLILPFSVGAQGIAGGDETGGEIGDFLTSILDFVDSIIIPFILSIGFLIFVWGMFKYFIQGGDNDDEKEKGKSLIMYAIAGFVVIAAFWGIVNIITQGIGLDDEGLRDTPKANLLD
ncbi:MAG: Type secretion system pilin [Candidatus Parcubacteria bacterium]|jgi:hypothetical protein